MKNNRIYLALALCLSFIFFMIFPNSVYAQADGTLNITFSYENKGISGAEFSIYQVADLKTDKTGYIVKAPFKYDGDFRDIKTADDHIKLALKLEKQSKNVSEKMTLQTSSDGKVSFSGLKDGIYLVVQTGATGEAKDYTNMHPFLVMVPQFENSTWNKVVNAKPKPEVQRKEVPGTPPGNPPQTPPDNPPVKPHGKTLPNTGDNSGVFWWSGLLMISGGLLVILGRKKDKIGEMS